MNFIAQVGVCGPQSFGISTYTIYCAEWTMYTMGVYTIQSKLYILWKSTMSPGATTWSIQTMYLLEINRTVVVCLPTYISMHRTRVEFLVP